MTKQQKWSAKNPLADRAHRVLNAAIKSGRLHRPFKCSRCGNMPGRGKDGRTLIHGHHHLGYSRPLAIEWICPTCHKVSDPSPCGEKHGRAKLTIKNVLKIRALYSNGMRDSDIAQKYKLSRGHVCKLVSKRLWKHV